MRQKNVPCRLVYKFVILFLHVVVHHCYLGGQPTTRRAQTWGAALLLHPITSPVHQKNTVALPSVAMRSTLEGERGGAHRGKDNSHKERENNKTRMYISICQIGKNCYGNGTGAHTHAYQTSSEQRNTAPQRDCKLYRKGRKSGGKTSHAHRLISQKGLHSGGDDDSRKKKNQH
jgi:hypothetical protein